MDNIAAIHRGFVIYLQVNRENAFGIYGSALTLSSIDTAKHCIDVYLDRTNENQEMKENLYTPNCIRTYTGKYLDVFNPDPALICIQDIAHALSQMPRFGGHLPKFYSVAQHSWACAKVAPEELKLTALLHDASEAYMMDMPRPIKLRMNDYRAVEDNLMKVIAQKLRFEWPLPAEVKMIDQGMLQLEWDQLMLRKQIVQYMPSFSPETMEKKFINYYKSITLRKYI